MLIALFFLLGQAPRETPPAARPPERVLIKAAHLIDGFTEMFGDMKLVEDDFAVGIG